MLVLCLFVPQFRDCNGHDKDAFDTSTAPMMIALAIIGVLPIVWRWLPRVGDYEDLAGLCGALIAIAFIAFFPVVGLFSDWYQGAWATWAAAWVQLAAMVTWTTAATTRKQLQPRQAIPARPRVQSALTDHAE
ncbi:MAG TPA: hypothetical protein VL326_01480 [Kofleriaceae bacterium]|nr:hypothetical protein [Kofleriaceae bacterium]